MDEPVWSATLVGLDARLLEVVSLPWDGGETTLVGGHVGPPSDALARASTAVESIAPSTSHSLIMIRDAGPIDSPGIGLAFALLRLVERGALPIDALTGLVFWADVRDDGTLAPAVGARVVADAVCRRGSLRLVVAAADGPTLAGVSGLEIIAAATTGELVTYLRDVSLATDRARRAVEVLVAGGHGLLLIGRRSRLALALIEHVAGLSDFDPEVALRAAKLHGLAGLAPPTRPPVRVVRSSMSGERLLGGGRSPRPGEVSLADGGVLLFDGCGGELLRPSWSIGCDGWIEVGEFMRSRFPTPFAIAARLRPGRRARQLARRVDQVVALPLVQHFGPRKHDEAMRARIALARERQRVRLDGTDYRCNGNVPASGSVMTQLWSLTEQGQAFVERLREPFKLSRVARTIADLDLDRDPAAPLDVDVLALAAELRPQVS